MIAHFNGNNLKMEKDWEMMSEFDKDKIIRKKNYPRVVKDAVLFFRRW